MVSGNGAAKPRERKPATTTDNRLLITDMKRLLSRENLIAITLCFLVILLIIATTDSAPQWIYQGF